MRDQADTALSAPDDRVCHWLSVVGAILGAYGVVESVILLTIYGNIPFERWPGPWPLTPLHHLQAFLTLASPVPLLVGAVARLRGISWGPLLMVIYAFVWLFGSGLAILNRALDITFGAFGPRISANQKLLLFLGHADLYIYGSVLAVAILYAMGRSVLRGAETRRVAGFQPTMRDSETRDQDREPPSSR